MQRIPGLYSNVNSIIVIFVYIASNWLSNIKITRQTETRNWSWNLGQFGNVWRLTHCHRHKDDIKDTIEEGGSGHTNADLPFTQYSMFENAIPITVNRIGV